MCSVWRLREAAGCRCHHVRGARRPPPCDSWSSVTTRHLRAPRQPHGRPAVLTGRAGLHRRDAQPAWRLATAWIAEALHLLVGGPLTTALQAEDRTTDGRAGGARGYRQRALRTGSKRLMRRSAVPASGGRAGAPTRAEPFQAERLQRSGADTAAKSRSRRSTGNGTDASCRNALTVLATSARSAATTGS